MGTDGHDKAEKGKNEEGMRRGRKLCTRKDVVLRFFQDNGIPAIISGNVITGTIYLKGCSPAGCGSDTGLLGLTVEIDKEGTVSSKPLVGALYTDCL